MKKTTFLLIISAAIISCSSGPQTVPESVLSPFVPASEEGVTYYTEIDPSLKFYSYIELTVERYMNGSEYVNDLSGYAQFYTNSETDLTPTRADENSCNQYLVEEDLPATEDATTLNEIKAGDVYLMSSNTQIYMPYLQVSIGPGVFIYRNFVSDSSLSTIYLDATDFTGFGENFNLINSTLDCQDNECFPEFDVENAFTFPDNLVSTPSLQDYTVDAPLEIRSLSDLSFIWENNNSLTDENENPRLVTVDINLYSSNTSDATFSSQTNCSLADAGTFDPTNDTNFTSYIESLLTIDEGTSYGVLTIKRQSIQNFSLPNEGEATIVINISDSYDIAFFAE